jgi:hypothetical protein
LKKSHKKIIGRRELVDFPDLELFGVEAKIDTGAYTSSIHCKDVEHFNVKGVSYVSFVLLDPSHALYDNKKITMPLHEKTQVRNSFGHTEDRCVILTKLSLFGFEYSVELSLSDRSLMDYPLLLGRKAIKGRFIVDVSKLHRWYNSTKKNSV